MWENNTLKLWSYVDHVVLLQISDLTFCINFSSEVLAQEILIKNYVIFNSLKVTVIVTEQL